MTDRVTKTQIVNKPFKNNLNFAKYEEKYSSTIAYIQNAALKYAIFVEKEISCSILISGHLKHLIHH